MSSNASVNQIAQDLLELSRKLELVRSNSKNSDREASRLSHRPESGAGSVVSQSLLSARPESADAVTSASVASYRPESSASRSDSKLKSNRSSSRASSGNSGNGGFNLQPASLVSNGAASAR